jgi:hypothetical protein
MPCRGFQYGFWQDHLMTRHLLLLTEWTSRALNFKKVIGAVFLNFGKTFNQVWREGLLHKPRSLSVPRGLYNVLKSYPNGRAFSMCTGDTPLPLPSLATGAPSFAPFICNLYERHALAVEFQHESPSTPMIRSFTHRIYSVLLTPLLISVVIRSCYICNEERSAFNNKKYGPLLALLTLDGGKFPWCAQAKYLGVIIDNNFSWQPHGGYVVAEFKAATKALYPLLCG